MWSKYHPFWEKLKASSIDLLSDRLAGVVLGFAGGLLTGFIYGGSWLYFLGMGITGVLFYQFRKNLIPSFVFLMLGSFFLAMGWVQIPVKMKAHPVLTVPVFQIDIQGEIQENLVLPDKQILILKNIRWPRSDLNNPDKVQLILKHRNLTLKAQDQLSAEVSLYPLEAESLKKSKYPLAYFQGIGARGEILNITHIWPSNTSFSVFEKIRQAIVQKLFQILPENQARIATPLIIGEQKFVLPAQYQVYRQAGIVHVLSVSGFHMALLAGFLFFVIRGLCALIPYLALHFNSKKIAAVLAWLGTLFYLTLSGYQIPAVRSFGMISLVFLGILIDRPAFSKNSLLILAFLLLLIWPENILSISFQLSFLSVLILISVHDFFQKHRHKDNRFTLSVCEFLTLNIAITFGLLPLIAWHFNLINPYGIFGNMLLSVVFSLGVMPCLFVGCLLMPLGLESGFFTVAGFLLNHIESFCQNIAQWPNAEVFVPTYSSWALCLFLLGVIVGCLYHTIGRFLCVALFCGAMAIQAFHHQADIVAYQGALQWVEKGQLYQTQTGPKTLQQRWAKQRGFAGAISVLRPDYLRLKGKKIALTANGCLGADMALLSYADSRCHAPTFVMDSNLFYQVFIAPKEIKITQGAGVVFRIKP